MGTSNTRQRAEECTWVAYTVTRKTDAQWARGREAKGRADARHSSMQVSCWIAWTVARLWLSGGPNCTLMCCDMRHAHGGRVMRE